MTAIKILTESEDTVTISRDDWARLQDRLDELQDAAAIAERRAYERLVGKETARQDYLTTAEAMELLNGVNPVKVWRRKRGISQRALAAAIGTASSYLAEIETDRKPGSDDIYRKLATVLQVPADEIDRRLYRSRDPDHGPVVLLLNPASPGGSWAERMDFLTVRDALDFARDEWLSLRGRTPRIAEPDLRPIYGAGELFREMEA